MIFANISCVTMALSFHFPELMMMKPIVEQPPSTREPVPMQATLFKTGEMTFPHVVCFLIFKTLCICVTFRFILALKTAPRTQT